MKVLTPREYLSHSQFQLFERNPETYRKNYFEGKEQYRTDSLAFGSLVAEALEKGNHEEADASGLILSTLPVYDLKEHEIRAEVEYWGGRRKVPLLAKIDSVKSDLSVLLDYKTGKLDKYGLPPWSQEKADECDQLTFYAMTVQAHIAAKNGTRRELATIPDLAIVWAETRVLEANKGIIGAPQRELTGRVEIFNTTRTQEQIEEFILRVGKVWEGIKKMAKDYQI